MNKFVVCAALACLCLAGCVQGRVRVLNLDFRKPDQIKNGIPEAEAPFKDWGACPVATEPPAVKTEALPVDWYTALFAMISKLEARLCLLELEWKDATVTKAAAAGFDIISTDADKK